MFRVIYLNQSSPYDYLKEMVKTEAILVQWFLRFLQNTHKFLICTKVGIASHRREKKKYNNI